MCAARGPRAAQGGKKAGGALRSPAPPHPGRRQGAAAAQTTGGPLVLTAELVRPRLRVRGTEVSIDMLDAGDAYWLQSAAELIALWQGQAGQSQAAWNRAVESYEG